MDRETEKNQSPGNKKQVIVIVNNFNIYKAPALFAFPTLLKGYARLGCVYKIVTGKRHDDNYQVFTYKYFNFVRIINLTWIVN